MTSLRERIIEALERAFLERGQVLVSVENLTRTGIAKTKMLNGIDETEEAQVVLADLVQKKLLDRQLRLCCPEGHTVWVGPDLPEKPWDCQECDEPYPPEEAEELFYHSERLSLSDAYRDELMGRKPFTPEVYQKARDMAEGALLIENLLKGFFRLLLLVERYRDRAKTEHPGHGYDGSCALCVAGAWQRLRDSGRQDLLEAAKHCSLCVKRAVAELDVTPAGAESAPGG